MANGQAVLSSWKDIAQYMGKGVRTVQRWEQEFGLPVRRPQGKDRQIVLAFPEELDRWLRTQAQDTRGGGERVSADRASAKLARLQQLMLTVRMQVQKVAAHTLTLQLRLDSASRRLKGCANPVTEKETPNMELQKMP